jgi:hypothetical protein
MPTVEPTVGLTNVELWLQFHNLPPYFTEVVHQAFNKTTVVIANGLDLRSFSVLLRVVFAVGNDRPAEPAGLLGMQTGRSLLVFRLAFVSVVLVGPELTQGTGHVTGPARVAGPRDQCSPQSRS